MYVCLYVYIYIYMYTYIIHTIIYIYIYIYIVGGVSSCPNPKRPIMRSFAIFYSMHTHLLQSICLIDGRVLLQLFACNLAAHNCVC